MLASSSECWSKDGLRFNHKNWGWVIKTTKAQFIFAWGFVGVVWLLCSFHIFPDQAEVEIGSDKGIQVFVILSGLIVFVLGVAHHYLQQVLMKIINRFKVNPEDNYALMRLNRFGIMLIFLEVILIYQVAQFLFETVIL